ncbi:MAG: hypothetical protein M1824_002166 [Vezdaea acicularis]|nr:MAG: hypothetical protein M1824_002166 [Vezdaea acicularis]
MALAAPASLCDRQATTSTLLDGASIPSASNHITASWAKAVDLFNSRLTKDDHKRIDLSNFQRASFPDLLSAATTAKDTAERERYPWTNNIQNIFSQINRYAVAGDLIVQHHAEYTSLAWGAFRFLLLFTVAEGTTAAKLSGALRSTCQIIFRAEEYAKLFCAHSGSSTERVFQSLQENIIQLYAEILNFLVRATKFFEKHTLRRYISAGLSPFDTKFQGVLDAIDRAERNVEKDIGVLRSEAEIRQQEYDNGVWLKHADFSVDLKKLQDSCIPGTCEWFLQSRKYIEWRNFTAPHKPNLLWVQGKPGSGKSTLAAKIVQDMRSMSNVVVLHVLCKDGEENKDDLQSVLRNLVFQLLEKSPHHEEFHKILQSSRFNSKTQYVQSMETLWAIFRHMLEGSDQICCILDGLDECNNSQNERLVFFSRLKDVFESRVSASKLVIISRLDHLETGEDTHQWACVPIQTSDVREDIKKYATSKIQTIKVLDKHPQKQHLLEVLVDHSDGMILWTELMIKELESGHWDVERVLQTTPRGLSEVYTVIINRIAKVKTSLKEVYHALHLVLAAARPLDFHEIALGLATTKGLRNHEDYDHRGDPIAESKAIVLQASPLLSIMPDGTVQLIHTSLKQYFFDLDGQLDTSVFRFQERDVHETMSHVLVSYLSFDCFDAELIEQYHSKYYLLEYASRWLVHHSTQSANQKKVANRLLSFFKIAQGWRWLQRLSEWYRVSHSHLQLMQSQIRLWTQSLDFDYHDRNVLDEVLTVLAQKRLEATISSSSGQLSIMKAMANLASNYQDQGRLEEAMVLNLQVVETRNKVLGSEHPDTLTGMANLASTYRSQGRWNEAELLQLQVMETGKKVLGPEHPDTLIDMANLALTYRSQGRWDEAELLQLQVMETRKKVLGPEHPHTLTGMANLASTYMSQGRWDEAEVLQLQAMETKKKVLGPEHPGMLNSMANLASTYRSQGRWNEAELLQLQVMKIREKVLGPEHPDTLTDMAHLAMTYMSQGRWNEAEVLQLQVMETGKKVLGLEHPDMLTDIVNLASTYRGQGRWKDAELLQLQAMETRKKVLGLEHPGTLSGMANLALTYMSQGRWDEAELLQLEAMETRKKVLGLEHPHTLTVMANLAMTYMSQGRWNEAEVLQLQVMETGKKVLGLEHPDMLTDMVNLASTYRGQGRWKDAELLQLQAMETRKKVLGPEHPNTLIGMANLAMTYKEQGQWNEAEALQLQIQETEKKVLGSEHPHTLTDMANLACMYRHQGRWKEAQTLELQVMETRKKVMGPEHPDTVFRIEKLSLTCPDDLENA